MSNTDWIEWNGGECPVAPDTHHMVRFRDSSEFEDDHPQSWYWGRNDTEDGNDIIAYRILSQPEAPAPDPVTSPPHYTAGEIECIDAIRAALTPEEFRGFCKGNVIKYTWRERHKGQDESLAKAVWYLERLTK